MKKIILASASPRRREILNRLNLEYEIIKPDSEENIIKKVFSYKLVEEAAESKCNSVINKISEPAIIISADTVVIFNDIILGKPKDFDDALRILKTLNNNTHTVVTSICIKDNETKKQLIKSETSHVTFNQIDESEIKDYIYNFRPYDKAGAYGIQELQENHIKEIDGDYDNIVGLPLNLLKNMLSEITNIQV